MRITILIENAAGMDGLATEHGFSCLVETEDGGIIFDTGTTGAFLDNARRLGHSLANVGAIVISHGHYDHAGGFRTWQAATPHPLTLWTGTGFFDKK